MPPQPFLPFTNFQIPPHTLSLSLSPSPQRSFPRTTLYITYILSPRCFIYLPLAPNMCIVSSEIQFTPDSWQPRRYYYVRTGSRGVRKQHSPKRPASEHVGFFQSNSIQSNSIQFNSHRSFWNDPSPFDDNWTEIPLLGGARFSTIRLWRRVSLWREIPKKGGRKGDLSQEI